MRSIVRPYLSRRRILQLGGGLAASWFAPSLRAQSNTVVSQSSVQTANTARNAIFILLAGAPSHIDTFDYKQTAATPLDLLKPEARDGIVWPTGLLPKLGQQIPDFTILRSMKAWALVHQLAQTWTQIGRSPVAALGDIAPNIGSIVALEKEADRRPDQVFPTFLSFNSQAGAGPGYLPSAFAPFKITDFPTSGLRNTQNPDDSTGSARFSDRTRLLATLDGQLRDASPYGKPLEDMDDFYQAARGMMYNPNVQRAFQYTAQESALYGNNTFGNACMLAAKVLAANQGTRFIQITLGGWDHHDQIYAANNLPRMTKILDDAVSQLLTDLKSSGLLNETLVVMLGEFGRTVGALSGTQGRDHFLQQFAFLAGAGVKGGRAIGSTNAAGSATLDPGWSRQRDIRVEDLEATIYSALGINWTTVRYDDPLGRGFYYVPESPQDLYGPINELWS